MLYAIAMGHIIKPSAFYVRPPCLQL